MAPIVNQSTRPTHSPGPALRKPAQPRRRAPPGAHTQGRCGYGPRLPLLVISPWSKPNFVDHAVTDQSSIIRFVEDNWLDGQRITRLLRFAGRHA